MTKQETLNFYRDKRVFLTGHTGFKGAWLTKILLLAGAHITGYSLEPPTRPSLFSLLGLDGKGAGMSQNHSQLEAFPSVLSGRGSLRTAPGDVRDYDLLAKTVSAAKPEIVFHFAAQPIVRESYKSPRLTYETNVMGTVNLLEAVRDNADTIRSFLNVTTDKVYKNKEWRWGYRESEPLDGYDPYSNSKSCSELVTHAYINSFFGGNRPDALVAVSTARAGNVIGGGDFAADRILPDCVRSVQAGEKLLIRNPNSLRPYQHVLEPLFCYLTIAAEQAEDYSKAGFYNVGPDDCDCITTGELADLFGKYYGGGFAVRAEAETDAPHEANFLKLDTSLVKQTFGYQPTWHIEEAVKKTVEWTKAWFEDSSVENIHRIMERQITEFISGHPSYEYRKTRLS